jgi:hypothetical protein
MSAAPMQMAKLAKATLSSQEGPPLSYTRKVTTTARVAELNPMICVRTSAM